MPPQRQTNPSSPTFLLHDAHLLRAGFAAGAALEEAAAEASGAGCSGATSIFPATCQAQAIQSISQTCGIQSKHKSAPSKHFFDFDRSSSIRRREAFSR